MKKMVSTEAAEEQRNYKRQYRAKNRERINAQQRKWRADNPTKVREYQKRYWESRAKKRNIRAGWEDYGLSRERRGELAQIVRSGEHAGLVLDAAMRADEKAAGHIILSVANRASYEHVEFDRRLGRCPAGRSDFYGMRRLFFHYLDCALKETETKNEIKEPAQGQI